MSDSKIDLILLILILILIVIIIISSNTSKKLDKRKFGLVRNRARQSTCLKRNFFKIDLSICLAGLSHQKSNFISIIRYCYHNNFKLIKPIFTLSGKHNNDKLLKTDLSEYYDLNGITINGKKFRLYNDDFKKDTTNYKAKNSLVRLDRGFSDLYGNVNIPYKKDIINIAKKVSSQLGEYLCIHVRRGDRITNNQIDVDTQPDNIIKVINKYKPKSVYIMTNKLNELKALSNIKNIYFYTHFNFLENISDNYYLFCIENNIMNFAKIRCSTFNTKLNKNNNYHCYLTDYPGDQ